MNAPGSGWPSSVTLPRTDARSLRLPQPIHPMASAIIETIEPARFCRSAMDSALRISSKVLLNDPSFHHRIGQSRRKWSIRDLRLVAGKLRVSAYRVCMEDEGRQTFDGMPARETSSDCLEIFGWYPDRKFLRRLIFLQAAAFSRLGLGRDLGDD